MNRKGFTLLEILIAVGIVMIVAGSQFLSFSSSQKLSRDQRRKADIELMRSALEQYRSQNNDYPSSLTFSCTSVNSLQDTNSNVFLTAIPKDPACSGGFTYYYSRLGNSDYTLGTFLENGSTTSTCGTCKAATTCNYCLGPYGVK